MRKLAILLALLLWTAPFAHAEERTGASLSYGRIVEMAEHMRTLAEGDYLAHKQLPDAMRQTAAAYVAGIGGQPRLAVELDVNSLSYLVETRALFAGEPEIVRLETESTILVSIINELVRMGCNEAGLTDADHGQVSSINGAMNAAMMYAEDGRQGSAVYIVLYDNASPLIYYVYAENGSVSIQGMFLPSAKLAKCQNYGQISLWLMLNGFSITCEEIKSE